MTIGLKHPKEPDRFSHHLMFVSPYITIFFCLIFITLPQVSNAQIKTSVSSSNPWVSKVKEWNRVRKDLKSNDQLDPVTGVLTDDFKPFEQIPADDLSKISEISQSIAKYQALIDSLESDSGAEDQQDSIGIYNERLDSCKQFLRAYANAYLADQDFADLSDSLMLISSVYDSSMVSGSYRDSLLLLQLTKRLEDYAHSKSELNELKKQEGDVQLTEQRLDLYRSNFNKYRDSKNLKSNMANLGNTDLAKKSKTISKAHEQIAKHKRKYLTLPSSAALEGGSKRNAVDDLTFWQRMKIGGNLRISHRHKRLDVDFSPSLAFIMSKKLSVGSEFMIRSQFGERRRWYRSIGSETYGVRLFTDYMLIRNFFAHVEYEQIHRPPLPTSESRAPIRIPGAMAGAGKVFDLGKRIRGKVIVQYNFIYDQERAVYPGPWVVRFGFEIAKNKTKGSAEQLK